MNLYIIIYFDVENLLVQKLFKIINNQKYLGHFILYFTFTDRNLIQLTK